jgi:VWFA-related protein
MVWLAPLGLLAAGIAVTMAVAQEPTLKVDVDLVNILFTVREKNGPLVGNLNKEDFTLLEDGKEQTIKHFERESDLPLTIGLLIDVSVSQQNLIEVEKNAAGQFFQRVLRPKDMAFLISFGPEAELLQDDTNSPKLLRAAMNDLKVSGDVSGIMGPGPVPTANSRPHGTILFDAVYLASADKLKSEVGRKAIVLITDGQDQGSRYKVQQAVEAAQRADAVIYSIQYIDNQFYSRGYMMPAFTSDSDLKKLSDETGGRVMRVDRKHTLQDIFDEIQQEMRTQYAISYTSTNPTKDNSFRRIEIRTGRKDLKVQARRGYYASPT